MRKTATGLIALIGLAVSACGENSQTGVETEPTATEPSMDEMAMDDASGETATTEGNVVAIDQQAGTITIDHAPVPEVNWPAMTMAFEADEEMMSQVQEGDAVSFEFRITDSGSELVSIHRN